jgi:hypothetical protein
VGEAGSRYEAVVAPDGRVLELSEHGPDGPPRPIQSASAAGVAILAAGRDILYRFDDERRLRNLPYPEVLEAMRQEIQLTLYKVRHGELLDEPELAPILRRLLAELEATATAFQEARKRLPAQA